MSEIIYVDINGGYSSGGTRARLPGRVDKQSERLTTVDPVIPVVRTKPVEEPVLIPLSQETRRVNKTRELMNYLGRKSHSQQDESEEHGGKRVTFDPKADKIELCTPDGACAVKPSDPGTASRPAATTGLDAVAGHGAARTDIRTIDAPSRTDIRTIDAPSKTTLLNDLNKAAPLRQHPEQDSRTASIIDNTASISDMPAIIRSEIGRPETTRSEIAKPIELPAVRAADVTKVSDGAKLAKPEPNSTVTSADYSIKAIGVDVVKMQQELASIRHTIIQNEEEMRRHNESLQQRFDKIEQELERLSKTFHTGVIPINDNVKAKTSATVPVTTTPVAATVSNSSSRNSSISDQDFVPLYNKSGPRNGRTNMFPNSFDAMVPVSMIDTPIQNSAANYAASVTTKKPALAADKIEVILSKAEHATNKAESVVTDQHLAMPLALTVTLTPLTNSPVPVTSTPVNSTPANSTASASSNHVTIATNDEVATPVPEVKPTVAASTESKPTVAASTESKPTVAVSKPPSNSLSVTENSNIVNCYQGEKFDTMEISNIVGTATRDVGIVTLDLHLSAPGTVSLFRQDWAKIDAPVQGHTDGVAAGSKVSFDLTLSGGQYYIHAPDGAKYPFDIKAELPRYS